MAQHVPNPKPGAERAKGNTGRCALRFESLHKGMRITDTIPMSFSDRYPFRIIQLSRPLQLSSNSQTPLLLPTEAGEGVLKTSYRIIVHDQGKTISDLQAYTRIWTISIGNTFAATYGCKVLPLWDRSHLIPLR